MGLEVITHGGIRYAEIIRADVKVDKTTFFSPAESSFQFGLLAHEAGFVEPPHYHREFERPIKDLQQMFVVQRGVVGVQLFSDEGDLLREVELRAGDAIVLIHGVHAIRVIEDMQCISVKQGPFLGDQYDKVFVGAKAMIPVFEPDFGEEEIASVVAALRRGEISGLFGTAITDFEDGFAAFSGCKYGVAVTSGTTALHLAIAALDLKPGDEVLLSSSTNIATALAIIYANAVPVPVDSERETWNLDLDLIEDLITPRTRAIIPVHLFGHPVDMDRLNQIAKKHNLVVIEDCAEAHGAKCRGRVVGSFGDMNCFSFYANKVITTGEGGMVTTNDAALAERLRLLRNLAFTTPRYWHERAGFNFRMTGFQAAFGVAQLKKIDAIIEKKRSVARRYSQALASVPGLQLPTEKDWAFNVYWMYAITVGRDYPLSRNQLATHLKARGIDTRTFFCPMNQQPCLQERPGYRAVACPVADEIWETGMYLPSSITLTDAQIASVCDEIAHAATAAKV